jgi:hypothetical protein
MRISGRGWPAGARRRSRNSTVAYNSLFAKEKIMEADEINVIANTLADLAQRAAELRRYL